ncbi:hypothetical protein GTP56_18250 [Duganella sp. FT134W]|uniref:Membrane protein 6-pyruvoyl-tetrahydropterin synthase-related domain-containing protein n=1 Tax=Duganella margarita TaxID=2692170 RepID=A0A7X4H4I4_9BURK|nr:hypothetical protein [Duganella margarita]MYM74129.1 hypothetical protein [Duganella margarita]
MSPRILLNNKLLIACLIGLACALLLPSLMYGVRESHDINFHLMLFQSYRDAFQAGILYPRWLPDQMHGLGSPGLLLYPPLPSAFFVLVDWLTFHMLIPARVLGLGAFLFSAGSALTFFLWAKKSVPTTVALATALFYATAPYHLNIDLYARGAIAEYAAFTWIPLIFLGIRESIYEASVKAYLILIGGICALLLTHLLTAMLIAPLAAVYLLVCLRSGEISAGLRSRRFVLVALISVLAAALAAFYYVPAITLLPHANPAGLYRDVATTNVFFALLTPGDRYKMKLLAVTCLYLVCLVYFLAEAIRKWCQSRAIDQPLTLSLMWLAAGLLSFALISGAFPAIFRPPSPYSQVQYAWRLLAVIEFSLASLLVSLYATISDPVSHQRLQRITGAGLLLVVVMQLIDIGVRFHKHPMFANPMQDIMEVKWRLAPIEYFPAGTKVGQKIDRTFAPFEKYATAETPAFIDEAKGRIVKAERSGGSFLIHSVSAEASPVTIQQFYFLGWKATDETGHDLPVFRTEDVPLVTYIAPPGDHTVKIERVQTEQEHWGNMISLAAFVGLVLMLVFVVQQRKRTDSKQV